MRRKAPFLLFVLAVPSVLCAQQSGPAPVTAASIKTELRGFRKQYDFDKPTKARQISEEILGLKVGQAKFDLADQLASYATEGYLGRDTLQMVTDTLVQCIKETPQPDENGKPNYAYTHLAELARYENMRVNLDSPKYATSLTALDAADAARAKVDFSLTDMSGKTWRLSDLKGKIVMVNFWGTWCPPCRKEMPDLDAIYKQYKNQGLVILALSNEPSSKVEPYLKAHPYSYTFFLDPGSKVHGMYDIQSFPKTFIYNREGHIAAQTIDMRTRRQFLDLLAKAGLDTSGG